MARKPRIDKSRIFAVLLEKIRSELEMVLASQQSTHEGAHHEEAKAEHDKDTRAIEQSYLALGLARRVVELQQTVATLESLNVREFKESDAVRLTALVTARDEDEATVHYLVAPVSGGTRLDVDGVEITVVTPESPLGRAIAGKKRGEEFVVKLAKNERSYEILRVS